MSRNKLFLATLFTFIMLFQPFNVFAITWEPATINTYIHSKVVIFHCNSNTSEELGADALSPISIDNGDIIYISLFASGELVNYNYLGEQSNGIDEFTVVVNKVDESGNEVIEGIYSKDFMTPYAVYRINDFKEGLYRLEITATSQTHDYHTTTIKSEDEGSYSFFYFTIKELTD